MEPFSLEDFFLTPEKQLAPGAQLYLYRILSLLAADGVVGGNQPSISYQGAKKLAVQLGIDSIDKLSDLFRNLKIGELTVSINHEAISVTLSHEHVPEKIPPGHASACDLERGIIDGALEIITGMPVKTYETNCWSRGSNICTFEAFLDRKSSRDRYSPRPVEIKPATETGLEHTAQGDNQGRMKSWYMDLAARELARSRRHGRQLSIIYLDIDDLGQVNAEHGREGGDQIISAVSAALSVSCRTEDFLWYNGEDEFALMLSETDAEKAAIVAKRLSAAVFSAAEKIEFAAKVSASIGYSTFPAHADDVASLLESARSAQYLAKARGKGRIQVAVSKREEEENKKSETATTAAEAAAVKGDEGFAPRRSMTEQEEDVEGILEKQKKTVTFVVAMSGPLLMAGIKHIFSEHNEFRIVAELDNPSNLPDSIEDNRPDMVFTDMAAAISGDFAALRLIEEENLPCKFIIFADVVDQEVIKIASEFNVDAIILQSSSYDEIVTAISSAYEGKTIIPEEATAAIKELETQRQLLKELSERELEVLKLVAEGKSNSQIAQDLYITVNTVRFHLANIYQKLSVSNRTEAANCYLKQDMDIDGHPKLL